MWQVPSILGIVMANVVPTHWGLGFAGTLAMVGLALGLVNDRITAVAAIVAGAAAVASFALPLKLNILVAIAAAVAAGLVMHQADKAAERLRPSTS
jgi:predicted branched-subunit amino acid permease